MRLISQDRTIDVPYNFFSLSVASGKYKDVEYSRIDCHNLSSPHGTKIAEYETEEEAENALAQMHDAFIRGDKVFRFPQPDGGNK